MGAAQVPEVNATHPSGLQVRRDAENSKHGAGVTVMGAPRAEMATDEMHVTMFPQNGVNDIHALRFEAP